MNLDWDDIRYFVAAATGGSTLAASRALDVSQTTVARRIDQLEQRIAVRLFERHSGGYRLTAAGQKALDDAEAVAWSVEDFLALFPAGHRPVTGVIRLVAEAPLARPIVLPAIDATRRALPFVQWEMVAKGGPVEASDSEIALHLSPPRPQPGVAWRVLDGAVAWAAFARRAAPAPEPSNRVELRHTGSLAALLATARRGEGVAVLPVCLGQGEPDLAPCAGGGRARRTGLWISYPERRVPEAVIDALAEALLAQLQPPAERARRIAHRGRTSRLSASAA